MSDLEARFKTAADEAQKLKKRPDNNTMLKLYALFKQSTTGDVVGSRPGPFDMVSRMKYDAWDKMKGTAKDQAMQQYIDLVEQLKKG